MPRARVDPEKIRTGDLPFETAQLDAGIRAFFQQAVEGSPNLRIGQCRFGVYSFYDYDGEPIYVGQTNERLSGRVRRHLTNRRTDAVAMSVLDPYEVFSIEVWPLPEYQNVTKRDSRRWADACAHLSNLEAAVYFRCVAESGFNAVLNEKLPVATAEVSLPRSYAGGVVSERVSALRDHPDIRIARRAATIARLAAVISERSVKAGLRRTLAVQAKRLSHLAEQRFASFAAQAEAEDVSAESEDVGMVAEDEGPARYGE